MQNFPKISVFISGRGSNLKALLDSPVRNYISSVVSDNPAARGLEIAKQFSIPIFVSPKINRRTSKKQESDIISYLMNDQPSYIALAGYMQILSPEFIEKFNRNIVNIHPSLLPDFRGLNTHYRALKDNRKEHGCSVHWVSDVLDGGKVIDREIVKIKEDDNESSLAKRVLFAEHKLYPRVLMELISKENCELCAA